MSATSPRSCASWESKAKLAASSNLRDLLKLRHDDDAAGQARAGRRRTLLDVIRAPEDDDDSAPAAPPGAASATTAAPPVAARPEAASPAQGEERRVSLMALLEQAERQWATATASGRGAWTRVEQAAAAEQDEGDVGKGRGVGGRCCVCMSRRKGAAFVPCGHTFCRACAREVRAGRGRCPLCNAAIRDVLNLF
uniref:Uncharacterized protein n=1 Tax=Avena sativa TaxID=4498 RepID=A0ACD5Y7T5_AVESA